MKLASMNIPCKIGDQYTIDEENVFQIIWHILNNKAISKAYKTLARNKNNANKMYIAFEVQIHSEEEVNEGEIKNYLYNHAHDEYTYFNDISYEVNTKTYIVKGLTYVTQIETFTISMQEQGNMMFVESAIILENEEETSLINELRREKLRYVRSPYTLTKMSCVINKAYADEDDTYTATKIMIYKSIKNYGFYIENIEKMNQQLNLTIKTEKENAYAVQQAFTTYGIPITDIEEETFEVTKEEKDNFVALLNEWKTLLKYPIARCIKQYTWTEENRNKEREEIEKYENYEMQSIFINIESMISSTTYNDEVYYQILRSIRQVLHNNEFTIIEDKEDKSSIMLYVMKSKLDEFRISLIANNIPFTINEVTTITEDNVDEIIWHRLNNKAIDQSFKGKYQFTNNRCQMYILFNIREVEFVDSNIDDMMHSIYYNTNEAIIYVKDITKLENINKYNITGYAMYEQLNIFKEHMKTYNIDVDIDGATYMKEKQEKILFTKIRNLRKQFLPITTNTTIISFNIKQIYEDNIDAHKMMIYKTINNSNYYIENITTCNESEGYNVTICTNSEHANTIFKTLTTMGVNVISMTQETRELSYEERKDLNNKMQERNVIIKDPEYKNVKKYTWSENNTKCEYDNVSQHMGSIMRYIEVPTHIVSRATLNDVYEINIAYRRMLELPITIGYFILKYNTETQAFIISIKEEDYQAFIEQATMHNIPFRKSHKYQITEDNIDDIVHALLDNKAIQTTYNAGTGFLVTKDIYMNVKLTINEKLSMDDKIIKSDLYYTTRETKVLIREITHDVPTNKTIVQTIINPTQYEKMKEILQNSNITAKITGTTTMSTPEEQLELERLEQERLSLQKSIIKIAKAKFTIMHNNNDDINIDQYKRMIYKTWNTEGYYVKEVTREDTSNQHVNISIIMLQDNANFINQIMQKDGITFTAYEENCIETTKEEIDNIMLCMTERQTLLYGVDLDNIKHMSWSKNNEQQIKEYINVSNIQEIQEYDIIINSRQQAIDIDANKLARLKAIKKIPLDCEFWVIEKSQNDVNTYSIMSNADNDNCIINRLDAMNVQFVRGNKYTINEDNVNTVIWNILNNASIEHTGKIHKFNFDKKNLYIRAVHIFESQEEMNTEEEKENFYNNCRNIEIFLEDTKHDKNNHTCEVSIIGHMKDVRAYIDAYDVLNNAIITQGIIFNNEEEKQKLASLREERSTTINRIIEQEFINTPTEIKRQKAQQIFNEINGMIENGSKSDILEKMKDLSKYKGIKLKPDNEDNTYWVEYVHMWDDMLTHMEEDSFIYNNQRNKENAITTHMVKCPYCEIHYNNISSIQKHIVSAHNKKIRHDISFTLQYATMRNNTKVATMQVQKGYKCPYCTYICTDKVETYKHCETSHKNKMPNIKEGIIGESQKIATHIQKKHEEELREQYMIEQQKINERQAFIDTPLQTKIENVNNILENAITNNIVINNIEKLKDIQSTLTQYIGLLDSSIPTLAQVVVNGYNGKIVRKEAITNNCTTPNTEEALYAETIATLFAANYDDYVFMHYGEKEVHNTKFMINCPFCNQSCNNAKWMKMHIRQEHQRQSILKSIGYVWTYITSNMTHAKETRDEYFKARECYRCNKCGFQHINREEVVTHIKHAHKLDTQEGTPNIQKGIVGFREEANTLYDKLFNAPIFSPKYCEKMDPTIYMLMRNRESIATQTENDTHQQGIDRVDTETQSGERRGGARNNNNASRDREPSTPYEITVQCNLPILRIMKRLKSSLVGCYNMGASCYMNALMQALHNVKSFVDIVMQSRGNNYNIVTTLRTIFKALDVKQNISDAWYINLSDTNIYEHLQFSEHTQSDPREVLTKLLDVIDNTESEKEIAMMFDFKETKRGYTNNTLTTMANNILEVKPPGSKLHNEETYNIEDLINNAKHIEDFDQEGRKIAETHTIISPRILCVNICRTIYDRDTRMIQQDMYLVKIRKILQIDGNTYILRSIIVHHSEDALSGHFTTYVINGNKTYHIDDLVADRVNITLDDKYVMCEDIDDSSRTALVIYERLSYGPDAPIIRNHDPNSSSDREIQTSLNVENTENNNIISSDTQQQDLRTQDEQHNTLDVQTTEHNQQEQSTTNAGRENTNNVQENENQEITITQRTHEESLQHATETQDSTQVIYNVLENQIPFYVPRDDEITKIKNLDNEIKQELDETSSPEEFMDKIRFLKQYNTNYNTMPNLHINQSLKDVSIITIGLLKGTLPSNKKERLCGYPNCPKMLTSGTMRTSHYKKVHKMDKCIQYTPFTEILEILGVDIETKTSKGDNIEYIKWPLFKCPCGTCDFTTHIYKSMLEHINSKHKEAWNAVKSLTGTYKILWLMIVNKKNLTLDNILYEGKAIQCIKCGWCTTNNIASGNHMAVEHRELKKQKDITTQKVDIFYRFYERDGTHLTPYIDEDKCQEKEYRIHKQQESTDENDINAQIENDNENNIPENIESSNTQHTEDPQRQQDNNMQEQCTADTIHDESLANTQENDDNVTYQVTGNENDNNEEEDEDTDFLNEEEIQQAIRWHKQYYNMEESIPKFKQERRKVLAESMKSTIKYQIMPILNSMARKKIPDNAPTEEIVNGCLCYCSHLIVENARKALGIMKKKNNDVKYKTYRPSNTYEETLHNKKKARDAGEKIVKAITSIEELRLAQLDPGVLQNREDQIFDNIVEQADMLSEEMQMAIFNTKSMTREHVINTVNDIIRQGGETNIKTYIEHADNDIQSMEEAHRKLITKKTRDLFRLSPNRAMRYYIDPHTSPNCPIPINEIQEELAQRWQAPEWDTIQYTNEWPIVHRLTENDQMFLMNSMQDVETFKNVISTRDITSAHGTDGIGYWALKLCPDAGSKMMVTISKIIIKYGFMPTIWNMSRTILLYKKGDEHDLKNWRPLTIASCLYRTWTCALASCLQMIHMNCTKLFDENQKGFIKHKDGCLEHSNMITEAICDANRRGKDIYIASLDLRDAFGSVPHEYIKYVLSEMQFPNEIIALISDSYDNGTAKVRVGSVESEIINIHKGVKQGCPLSPLIFNFCMNPLLNKLEQEGEGYLISEDCALKVQAYADDIILFSSSREGLQHSLNIVDQFMNFAKVTINTNKCHTMSYVLRDNRRYYEEDPFQIANENIPVCDLSESIEYLGTDATTTNNIRKHGAMKAVEDTKRLIGKIGESVLSLNQKIYAIKTFAIPQLDYILTNKRISLQKCDEIDRLIRTTINKHIKGVNLPVGIFYTHWKDGGFSILKLKERAICLRAKTFMALYNSTSTKVRQAMRIYAESEREHREITTTGDNEEEVFLNWKISEKIKKGTDTIIIHALRSAKKLNLKFKINEETDNIEIVAKQLTPKENETNETPTIPEEIIGESPDNTVTIKTAKELMIYAAMSTRIRYRDELVSNMGTGHSFIDIKDAPYANKFIGDYKHPLNDTIARWIIKARCNMLFTGALALKTKVPREKAPHCPYCGNIGGDTIAHRLNICRKSMTAQTKRHNNIQNIILSYMESRLGKEMHRRTNITVNLEGKHLDEEYKDLKPDIVAWDNDKIILVEFSCPYANVGRNGNTLEKVYKEKASKYQNLVKTCKETYKKKVSLYIVIVSSLGAVYSKSKQELRKLLRITPSENKLFNTILRRISLASCIASYFIYNKLKFNEYTKDNINKTNINEGEEGSDTTTGEENQQNNSSQNIDSDEEYIEIEEGSSIEHYEEEDTDDSSNNEIEEEEEEEVKEDIAKKDDRGKDDSGEDDRNTYEGTMLHEEEEEEEEEDNIDGSDETDEEEGEEAEGHTSMSRQIPNFDENN